MSYNEYSLSTRKYTSEHGEPNDSSFCLVHVDDHVDDGVNQGHFHPRR